MGKIALQQSSEDSLRPWANLEPIVQALVASGNFTLGEGVFNFDKDGWYCLLGKPIDFDYLDSLFIFPDNIRVSRADASIVDISTWIEIKGAD
jgi:hypothetical protein